MVFNEYIWLIYWLNMLKLPYEISEDLAQKIRLLRKDKNLSQKQLAVKSGVSLGSLKRFESTGQISLESLLKIAMVLGRLNDFETLFQPQDELPASLDDILKS